MNEPLTNVSSTNIKSLQPPTQETSEKQSNFGKDLLNIGISIFNPAIAVTGAALGKEPVDMLDGTSKIIGGAAMGAIFPPLGMGLALNGVKDLLENKEFQQAAQQQKLDSEA